LAGILAGALFGGIIGVAAHYAAQRPTMDSLLVCSGLIAAPMFVVVFAACVVSYLSEGETWLYIPFGLVLSSLGSALIGLMAGCTLVLGAHVGASGTRSVLAGSLQLLLYAALWLAVIVLTSEAVLLGFERLALAAKGDLPVPLLAFLDDCTVSGILRRRGYSYEFKDPALRRVCLRPPSDWGRS
jgi:hypothetical protein